MDIKLSTQNLQELCAHLNEFALPRAIVDFEQHSFVAWNPRFLEQTGFSEDEMKASKPEELLTIGEPWVPLQEGTASARVEYVACATRRPFGGDPSPGYVVLSQSKIGYVMLDVFDSSSAQFEQGRITGREEERNQVIKAFHEEVSSSMIAALFLIETAKNELKEAGLPQAEAVSKASDVLAKSTEKIAEVIGEAERLSENHNGSTRAPSAPSP
jgi:PAS domain-containing protein